jgi:hypothetical protein
MWQRDQGTAFSVKAAKTTPGSLTHYWLVVERLRRRRGDNEAANKQKTQPVFPGPGVVIA